MPGPVVQPGMGSSLKATIASTLTAIAQVIDIDGPTLSVGTMETTNLASTIRTFRTQLPDPGELTATVQFDPSDTSHTFLVTALNTYPQAAVAYELDFGTTTHKATFNALVTGFHVKGMNLDDNLEADLTLKITGPVTIV